MTSPWNPMRRLFSAGNGRWNKPDDLQMIFPAIKCCWPPFWTAFSVAIFDDRRVPISTNEIRTRFGRIKAGWVWLLPRRWTQLGNKLRWIGILPDIWSMWDVISDYVKTYYVTLNPILTGYEFGNSVPCSSLPKSWQMSSCIYSYWSTATKIIINHSPVRMKSDDHHKTRYNQMISQENQISSGILPTKNPRGVDEILLLSAWVLTIPEAKSAAGESRRWCLPPERLENSEKSGDFDREILGFYGFYSDLLGFIGFKFNSIVKGIHSMFQ